MRRLFAAALILAGLTSPSAAATMRATATWMSDIYYDLTVQTEARSFALRSSTYRGVETRVTLTYDSTGGTLTPLSYHVSFAGLHDSDRVKIPANQDDVSIDLRRSYFTGPGLLTDLRWYELSSFKASSGGGGNWLALYGDQPSLFLEAGDLAPYGGVWEDGCESADTPDFTPMPCALNDATRLGYRPSLGPYGRALSGTAGITKSSYHKDYDLIFTENWFSQTTQGLLTIERLEPIAVAAVPLPAGAPLLLAGTGALLTLRRRR